MLLKLLKALFARRPAAAPAAAPAPRAQPVSQLAVLSKLASLAGGLPVTVSGKERPAERDAGGASAELPMTEIIARASALASDALDPASEARASAFTPAFARAARPGRGLNVLVFHVDLPGDATLNYVDVKFNPRHFDYLEILRRFIGRIRAHCSGATVYVVTAAGSRYGALAAPDVAPVELPIDGTQPMYDRATALLAYARSPAFDRDTVFLDSDALVNRPLEEVFALGFDVCMTYREHERLMPVNEGVMFLASRRPQAVVRFLERRLATYDRIAADPFITGYYGDVRRWRGGQLSLNALAAGDMPCSPYRRGEIAGAAVRFLPCDTFNFAVAEGEAASAVDRLDQRYVVHFKGWRKYAFGLAAQAERAAAPGG